MLQDVNWYLDNALINLNALITLTAAMCGCWPQQQNHRNWVEKDFKEAVFFSFPAL